MTSAHCNFLHFIHLNQGRKDVGSQEELHCAPPQSHSTAGIPVSGFLHAHEAWCVYTRLDNAFLSEICKHTEYVYTQYVVWHVLQVTLALFWTPRGPTSSVTALMIASTCSTSVGLKPLQVKNDYKLNVKNCAKACVLEFNANSLLLHDTRWGCRPMFCALAVI